MAKILNGANEDCINSLVSSLLSFPFGTSLASDMVYDCYAWLVVRDAEKAKPSLAWPSVTRIAHRGWRHLFDEYI